MVAVEMGVMIESDGRIPKEASKILHSMASGWSDVSDSRDVEILQLKGGLTNQVFKIYWRGEEKGQKSKRMVLVRVYGEGMDVFFDRDDEIRMFELISAHGQGPRLLARFTNGRVEEFINARTLSAPDLRDPDISTILAAKLGEFHDLDMPGPKKVHLWDRLRNWLKTAQGLCSSQEIEEFHLKSLEEDINVLEKSLSVGPQRIGFCHNDLQYGNIMMDEETRQITFIDYEYASFNPIAYDIANHFCEMTGDYTTDTPHILDYSKYPDLQERRKFVQAYLKTSGEELTKVEFENLLESIEQYTLASHLIWGLWGLISEFVNDIDFEYIEYARQRFEQYWMKKAIVMG